MFFFFQADEQADRLLAEKNPGKFMQHYLDVMKILDQSYNSCVMLTAEAESLYGKNFTCIFSYVLCQNSNVRIWHSVWLELLCHFLTYLLELVGKPH